MVEGEGQEEEKKLEQNREEVEWRTGWRAGGGANRENILILD